MKAGTIERESSQGGGQATQQRVHRAALQLIEQKGFAAMSMRQLAGLVGIQAGSLYRYVPSKQCLLFELLYEHFAELLAAWQRVEPEADRASPTERLTVFADHHLRWHEGRRQQGMSIDQNEARHLLGTERELVQQLRWRYRQQLWQIIDAGVRQGRFRCVDAPLCTDALLALLQGGCGDDSRTLEERCVGYRTLTLRLLR